MKKKKKRRRKEKNEIKERKKGKGTRRLTGYEVLDDLEQRIELDLRKISFFLSLFLSSPWFSD